MTLIVETCPSSVGSVHPLYPGRSELPGHRLLFEYDLYSIRPGTILEIDGSPVFLCSGSAWLTVPAQGMRRSVWCPLLQSLEDTQSGKVELTPRISGYSLAIITLSDKGSKGFREDLAAPEAAGLLADALPLALTSYFLIPDEAAILKSLLLKLALMERYNLVCTTGGTGLSPRDVTPQTTAAIIDLPLPGFSQAMIASSLQITPHAILSRAIAGLAGQTLIINLPGSQKAVRENLQAIIPALPHALAKIHGDNSDCGA